MSPSISGWWDSSAKKQRKRLMRFQFLLKRYLDYSLGGEEESKGERRHAIKRLHQVYSIRDAAANNLRLLAEELDQIGQCSTLFNRSVLLIYDSYLIPVFF
ncbi:hypothetical protein COLO4_36619 [Corchorus olitorius]|uniref:Uncharacterized protein n=1 Tax=Corchorus olitorius TaxID=93759 RepID=A0A1R3G772_9ROSI|nr:hypothetical protein COLO4_36619 [Corchorus olitorius]